MCEWQLSVNAKRTKKSNSSWITMADRYAQHSLAVRHAIVPLPGTVVVQGVESSLQLLIIVLSEYRISTIDYGE